MNKELVAVVVVAVFVLYVDEGKTNLRASLLSLVSREEIFPLVTLSLKYSTVFVF